MWAILAVVAFLVAFILHLAGGQAKYVTDAEILGWAFIALHLVWGYTPWRRQP